MMDSQIRRRSLRASESPTDRTGLTTLEFVACLVAVVGGAWLGALYLGVDVKSAAYTALRDSQLLNKVPKQWQPAPPKDQAMTRDELVATLHAELGSLRNQISSLRTGKNDQPIGEGPRTSASDDGASPTKERTLAYWSRLNEIALAETDLQQDAESAFSAANAAKVFAIKGRVSRFASTAVDAVPTEGVDEQAIKFGRRLKLWYSRGDEHYQQAVRIWETPMGAQARTKLNDEWKQADNQHHNESELIMQKAAAVRGSISRIYGAEFSEFGKPSAEAAKPETDSKSA
ncbi:MAG TPA: hypothetical protein VH107_12490 [Lacipirellulaceae bacterium]|jgi:hypothetical protein|nr:hypothetical protein [Lacipirellulaceae bacterium]